MLQSYRETLTQKKKRKKKKRNTKTTQKLPYFNKEPLRIWANPYPMLGIHSRALRRLKTESSSDIRSNTRMYISTMILITILDTEDGEKQIKASGWKADVKNLYLHTK